MVPGAAAAIENDELSARQGLHACGVAVARRRWMRDQCIPSGDVRLCEQHVGPIEHQWLFFSRGLKKFIRSSGLMRREVEWKMPGRRLGQSKILQSSEDQDGLNKWRDVHRVLSVGICFGVLAEYTPCRGVPDDAFRCAGFQCDALASSRRRSAAISGVMSRCGVPSISKPTVLADRCRAQRQADRNARRALG